MARKIGVRTIRVIRTQLVDPLDTTTPVTPEFDITGCAILPRASSEEGRGWVIHEGLMVIAPFGSDILATDRIVVDGKTWQVDGSPGEYEDRQGKGKAMILYLKRIGR